MSAEALRAAAVRLAEKGLLRTGDGLSARLPGEAAALRLIWGGTVERIGFCDDEGDLHRALYGRRPDAGAALIASPPWGGALGLLPDAMPGLFDEQVRHLGARVARLTARGLARGDNAFLLGEEVLCLGMTLDRLVFNAELLEKCAKAFLLARSAGVAPTVVPWPVRLIAGRRLRRDQRFAARCHAEGVTPIFKSAY